MTKKLNSFDRLHVANPCPEDWQQMTGNDRVRHCVQCDKSVYDLSQMTRDEAEALVARMEGRLCARFERQADGAILTAALASGPHLISRRVSPVATIIVTALLGLNGNAFAATTFQANEPAAIHAQSKADKADDKKDGGSFPLSGTVYDAQGAVIVGATLRLINEAGGQQRLTRSADDGTFRFASLPDGAYTLMVTADGFSEYQKENVNVRASQVLRADVTMQVRATMGEIISVPNALRTLYWQSNQIVVARLGQSVPVKKNAQNSMLKTALEVSSTLKGNNRKKTLYLYHWGWGEDQEVPGGFKTGDTVLIFLKPRVEENGYEVVDTSRGVKKLSEADLRVYRQRLEELAAITASARPDAAAIVEWLVRCAEDPATRWEGAYEIAASVRQLADDDNDADDDKDASENEDEDSSADEDEGMAVVNQSNPDANQQADDTNASCTLADSDAKLATMLTAAQKERLKAALFNTDLLAERDRELIEIVQHWHDARLVPFLVAQLRRIEANPTDFAETMMSFIADEIKDEEINQLAESYSNDATDEVSDDEASDEADESEPEETASVKATDEKAGAAKLRERHRAALHKFLALVEKKLAR